MNEIALWKVAEYHLEQSPGAAYPLAVQRLLVERQGHLDLIRRLAERVAAQNEILSRRAERDG